MSREQPEALRTRYSEYWNAGCDDYTSGYVQSECPYEGGSDEQAAWLEGWLDAQDDLRLAKREER